MLAGLLPVYVDRFARAWHRLATTDALGLLTTIIGKAARRVKHFSANEPRPDGTSPEAPSGRTFLLLLFQQEVQRNPVVALQILPVLHVTAVLDHVQAAIGNGVHHLHDQRHGG